MDGTFSLGLAGLIILGLGFFFISAVVRMTFRSNKGSAGVDPARPVSELARLREEVRSLRAEVERQRDELDRLRDEVTQRRGPEEPPSADTAIKQT